MCFESKFMLNMFVSIYNKALFIYHCSIVIILMHIRYIGFKMCG